MNSRDLVNAAIAHRSTARPPYCIGFTADGARQLQQLIGEVNVDAYVDNDVVRLSPPWWGWHGLGPDWANAAAPQSPATVIGSGAYQAFFDEVKRVHDEQEKYALATIYGSHFEKANFARGIENFLADLAGEPAFARRLLNRIIEKNLVMLENILSCAEIDGVLLGSDWGTQVDLIMSPATWEEMIRPGEQREYDLVRQYGKQVWIHSCGNVVKIIPALIEMGVDVLNPVQPEAMDLTHLKSEFGDRLTFWGGISTQRTLPYGTPEEVKEESRQVRSLLGASGGFVFSPAQEIQGDVPAENILALIEVARETDRSEL
jgi:uroporphyrinogen decarboxylase